MHVFFSLQICFRKLNSSRAGICCRNFFISIFFFCFSIHANSQDLSYARQIVNTLTSTSFHGRGYVSEGCAKAADFLAGQFDSLKLLPFTKDFRQPFTIPVNTFPSAMEISIDGKTLVPGDDFIVYPYSAGADRTCHLRVMTKYPGPEIFNTDPATCHAVVADSLAPNEHNLLFSDLESGKIKHGALILLQQKKLTWSVARSHYRIPVLSILQYFVPASAREISMRIDEQFIGKYKVSNLGGYIRGSQIPDSFIVFSAHYDHLGMMGSSVLFPGANDNASGVSMLLNLAKYFSMNAHRPKCSVAFIAFAGEEAGLLGSEYYTGHPLFPLSKIKFLINLDLLGTGDEGMMVVNATEYPMQFHILDSLNTSGKFLPRLGERGKAKNSDHYWFTEKGVPSFFFYTLGGIQAYHDIYDRSETLPFTAYEKVFRLIVEFTSSL